MGMWSGQRREREWASHPESCSINMMLAGPDSCVCGEAKPCGMHSSLTRRRPVAIALGWANWWSLVSRLLQLSCLFRCMPIRTGECVALKTTERQMRAA